jgi:hypothetical protein
MGRQYILSLYPKNFGYSLGGYSHREHWSCTRWQRITLSKDQKYNRLPLLTTIFDYIVDKMTSITPIGSYSRLFEGRTTRIFCTSQQSNKACKEVNNSQAKSSRQSLNAVVIKDHEGKTPGSVPVCPSIRTRMRSASNFPCLRREENPGGRTGYLENYWNSFFVSPKCGKRMG